MPPQRKISLSEMEQLSEQERTLFICICGMRWALEKNDRETVVQMIRLFPVDILLQCFVHSNIGEFQPNYAGPI